MTEVQSTLTKEALDKIVEKLDVDEILRFLVDMLAVLGELSVKIGEIEEENKETQELFKVVSSNPKLFLSKIIEKASAEEVKTLMRAMLRVDELSPKLSNLFLLKPEEKKEIGKELITLSKEIKEAYSKTKEKEKE